MGRVDTLTIYGCKGNHKLVKTGLNIHIFYQLRAKSIILKVCEHQGAAPRDLWMKNKKVKK